VERGKGCGFESTPRTSVCEVSCHTLIATA